MSPCYARRYDLGLVGGKNTGTVGAVVKRQGLSLSRSYSGADGITAGLSGEIRFEDSNSPRRVQDRRSLLLSGSFQWQTSENWRLVGNLHAMLADADTLHDGWPAADFVDTKTRS